MKAPKFNINRLLLARVEGDVKAKDELEAELWNLSRGDLILRVAMLANDYALLIQSDPVAAREWVLATKAGLLVLDEQVGRDPL